MKLYLVERTDKWSYDDYDEFVCRAETEEAARSTFPSEYYKWVDGKVWWYNDDSYNGLNSGNPPKHTAWTDSLENIKVTELGTANDTTPGVVCASFNAG